MAGQSGGKRKAEPLTLRPGAVYKPSRNRLYAFERRAVIVLSGGPRPQAWRKTLQRGWHPVRPTIPDHMIRLSLAESEIPRQPCVTGTLQGKDGQLLFPFMEMVRDAVYGDRAWVAWLRGFDVESRQVVAGFRERSWHMLMLALRCPGAIELMQCSPGLAFALGSSWVFRGDRRVARPLRSARSLVRKRQRAVAAWLGFPGTESVARILRRVPYEAIGVEALLYLRGSLCDPASAGLLCHVPVITRDVIRIISSEDLRKHASPRLLIEAGSERAVTAIPAWQMMRDTLAMFAEAGRDPTSLVFRSLEHLAVVHDEAVAVLNGRARASLRLPLRLPPPPLPGNELILPLSTASDFCDEAREQSNCIVTYASRVATSERDSRDGKPGIYVYRVLEPERATLSIRRVRGEWCLDELRCAHNQPAAPQTHRVVQEWLDEHNAPTGRNDWDDCGPEWVKAPRAGHEDACLAPF